MEAPPVFADVGLSDVLVRTEPDVVRQYVIAHGFLSIGWEQGFEERGCEEVLVVGDGLRDVGAEVEGFSAGFDGLAILVPGSCAAPIFLGVEGGHQNDQRREAEHGAAQPASARRAGRLWWCLWRWVHKLDFRIRRDYAVSRRCQVRRRIQFDDCLLRRRRRLAAAIRGRGSFKAVWMIRPNSSRFAAGALTLLMVNVASNSCRLLSTALDRRRESVRRDAERGGRDDRALRTLCANSSRGCAIANP